MDVEKSMVKQESQRRLRSAALSDRSFSSQTEVQKQVGHTIVQFAASQAALRHVIPTRVFQICLQ
jgi:hypothetical protein